MARLQTLTGKEANTIDFGLGPVGTMFKIGQRLRGMGLVWNNSTKVFDPKLKLGSQGTGIPTSTASPFAAEIHAKTNSDAVLVAGDSGLSCGIRCRYEISKAQTNQISLVGVEGRLRVKAAIADGNHAGVMGTIEADGAIAFTGTATTMRSAGAFAIELGESCSFGSTSGWLIGVSIDSSVHATQTGMSNITFAGLRIKKSSGKLAWEYGIYIAGDAVENGMLLGTSGDPITLLTAADHGIEMYTTCASQHASNSVNAVYVKSTMTGAGGVGGRSLFHTYADVALGSWCNGLKGVMEFGSSGRATGLASAVCAEIILSTAITSGGNYVSFEAELIANSEVTGMGSGTGFFYCNVAGDNTNGKSNINAGAYFVIFGAGVTLESQDDTAILTTLNATNVATHQLRLLGPGKEELWFLLTDQAPSGA